MLPGGSFRTPETLKLNFVAAGILRTRRPFFLLLLFLLLTTCADDEPKSAVANESYLSCETTMQFDDGTGYGNGILCLSVDYGEYNDLSIDVYHYRCDEYGNCDWWLYREIDVQSICENVLCNLEPSSLCMSAAQFWETGDGWRYASCRTGETPSTEKMSLWRIQGAGTTFSLMKELTLAPNVCEP